MEKDIEGKIFGEYTDIDVKTPLKNLDNQTMDLLQSVADDPWYEGTDVTIMPDVHAGKDIVIGYTRPVKDFVAPNEIGVDIGCGVTSVKLKNISPKDVKYKAGMIDEHIRQEIPVGTAINQEVNFDEQEVIRDIIVNAMDKISQFSKTPKFDNIAYDEHMWDRLVKRLETEKDYIMRSLGSLGGGNHFIEIGSDSEDNVYITVHTGSRKLGHSVAEYWDSYASLLNVEEQVKMALDDLNEDLLKYTKITKRSSAIQIGNLLGNHVMVGEIREDFEGERIQEVIDELRYLNVVAKQEDESKNILTGEKARDYIRDMYLASSYAHMNRELIYKGIVSVLKELVGEDVEIAYATESVHNVVDSVDKVVRKGACQARFFEDVVIPLNMDYGVLMCTGKGNSDWNKSAPHGAGRVMSRTQAKERFDMEEVLEDLNKDMFASVVPLDETPGAYKKPEMIESAITDTVDIKKHIKPLLSIKADS